MINTKYRLFLWQLIFAIENSYLNLCLKANPKFFFYNESFSEWFLGTSKSSRTPRAPFATCVSRATWTSAGRRVKNGKVKIHSTPAGGPMRPWSLTRNSESREIRPWVLRLVFLLFCPRLVKQQNKFIVELKISAEHNFDNKRLKRNINTKT